MDTQIAEQLTRDLISKSDKIRTLDGAGYSRSDIANYLGIRYQHVRKLLIESETKKYVDIEPLTVDILLKSGFTEVCEWLLDEDGEISMTDKLPHKPAVYSFCIDKVVMYVGVSSRSISQRLYFYRKPGPSQKTSQRIKALLQETLKAKKRISILIAYPENSEWNGLPVDIVTGLEAGLISHYKTRWNMRGK